MKLLSILLLGLAMPAAAAISFALPGSTEESVWTGLTNANYSSANGYTAATPWGPISANAGSSASFSKTAGAGYFLGSGNGIYSFNAANFMAPLEQHASTYLIADSSPIADLATIVFQARIALPEGQINPTLRLNGGPDIVADYYAITATGGADGLDYAWQWDLTGHDNITSYEIVFNVPAPTAIYASLPMSVTTGNTFAQVIPEPSTLFIALTGAAFGIFRRRRG